MLIHSTCTKFLLFLFQYVYINKLVRIINIDNHITVPFFNNNLPIEINYSSNCNVPQSINFDLFKKYLLLLLFDNLLLEKSAEKDYVTILTIIEIKLLSRKVETTMLNEETCMQQKGAMSRLTTGKLS